MIDGWVGAVGFSYYTTRRSIPASGSWRASAALAIINIKRFVLNEWKGDSPHQRVPLNPSFVRVREDMARRQVVAVERSSPTRSGSTPALS